MKPDAKITAVPRAMRIAYVVEDGEDAHNWLDAAFAHCYRRHAGRQSLLVPVVDGRISQPYMTWLKGIDPDVVLLATRDDSAHVPAIQGILSDCQILGSRRESQEIRGNSRFSLESDALTSLSWLPFQRVVTGLRASAPTMLLDSYPAWIDDGLVGDNFGTPSRSFDLFPIHDRVGLAPLMLTPPDAPGHRWHLGLAGTQEIPDGYAAIDFMLGPHGVTCLSRMANLHSQPHRIQHTWTRAFCLVVGDSFIDRVSCWNAGLLFDDAQHQAIKTFRLPAVALADPRKMQTVAQFIHRHNWINEGNGPNRIAIRSESIDAETLGQLADMLRGTTHSLVDVEHIRSQDECCPNEEQITRAWRAIDSSEQLEINIREGGTSIDIARPHHLRYCAGQHPIFSTGAWWLDLSIDRLNDNGKYSNVRESWTLPRRRQLVRHFIKDGVGRILSSGHISCSVRADQQALKVDQPGDDTIFWELMTQPLTFAYPDLRNETKDRRTYRAKRMSDKGRYLLGVLGLFENLDGFEQTMSTRFWQTAFRTLATPSQAQHQEVIVDLQRRMRARDGVLHIDDDAGWQTLAERVVQKGSRLRSPRQVIKFSTLLTAWKEELQQAVDAEPQLKAQEAEIMLESDDGLRRSLTYLVQRDIFYPGHEWSCRKCRHRNWAGISALEKSMPCEVCSEPHALPADFVLHFRLNEFFATCLREHDSLAVGWALAAIRDRSSSFVYIPQTELFRDYPENQAYKSDRELDIVCIDGGEFVVGECKAKVDLIRQSDLEDLANAVKEVRADVAVLAALEGTEHAMHVKREQLRVLLPEGTKIRILLSEWAKEPTWHLPY